MDNLQDYFGILILINLVLGVFFAIALLSWIRVNNANAKLTEYKLQEYESDEDEAPDEH